MGKAKTKTGLTAKTFKGLSTKRMQSKAMGKVMFFKEGETRTIQFLTDPSEFLEFDMHRFQESGWQYVPCQGEECPLCEDEDKEVSNTDYRFYANVYDFESKQVRILEGPKTLSTSIFSKYKKKPEAFLKRCWEVEKFGTSPWWDFSFDPDTSPINIKKLQPIDLEEEVNASLARYFGDEGASSVALDDDDEQEEKPKKKRGRPAKAKEDDDDDSDEDDEEIDFIELGKAADKDDEDAQTQLTEIAEEHDIDPDDYETWKKLAKKLEKEVEAASEDDDDDVPTIDEDDDDDSSDDDDEDFDLNFDDEEDEKPKKKKTKKGKK